MSYNALRFGISNERGKELVELKFHSLDIQILSA